MGVHAWVLRNISVPYTGTYYLFVINVKLFGRFLIVFIRFYEKQRVFLFIELLEK